MSLRTRPWNRVAQPVYSLSTTKDGKINMNICTYVSPLTMKPKQFMLGVYHNTQTWHNLKQTNQALLQVLSQDQSSLVRTLGKKSGQSYDKHSYLQSKVAYTKNLAYLTDCLAYIHLQTQSWIPESDHDLVIAKVISWKNIQEGVNLTTHHLKKLHIIG